MHEKPPGESVCQEVLEHLGLAPRDFAPHPAQIKFTLSQAISTGQHTHSATAILSSSTRNP